MTACKACFLTSVNIHSPSQTLKQKPFQAMEIRLDAIKKFIIQCLYVGFLIGGIVFSLDTVKQYLEFNTSFLTITEPLLLEDAPVITICYPRGGFPEIRGKVRGEIGGYGEAKKIIEPRITDVLMGKYASGKNCWKIALESKVNETSPINFSDRRGIRRNSPHFQLWLNITQPKEWQEDRVQYEILMTSKENFFGLGRQIWYDGEVASGIYRAKGQRIVFTITHAIQTNFIHFCSEDSYFKTVGKEYVSANLTEYSPLHYVQLPNGTREKRKCDYRELCLPLSLPLDIPQCNVSTPELESIERQCQLTAFKRIERKKKEVINNGNIIYKSCTIMEYKFVELNEWMRDKNGIEFVFLFKTARLLNRGWSDSVLKTIHQEYFIMNEKEFVGLIGGTMGLFVGLSFMDINIGIVDLVTMLISRNRK